MRLFDPLARFEGQPGLQISDLGLAPSLELALMLGALEKRSTKVVVATLG